MYLYDSYVFQNGIECKEDYTYTSDDTRNVSYGAQYTFTKRYILQNEIDDITIEVVASAINPEDATNISITYTMSGLLGIENKENPKDDTDYNSFLNDINDESNIDISESIEYNEDYCGLYTAENERDNTVTISYSKGEYKIDIFLVNLIQFDNGKCMNFKEKTCDFAVNDSNTGDVYGRLSWLNDYNDLKLVITDSKWGYLENGTELTFTKVTNST